MSKTVVVVEITTDFLSVVEVKGSQKCADIERHVVRALPEGGINAEWLRQIWQQETISQNRVICILPNRFIKYKSLTLPELPDNQLENAIRMELDGNGNAEDNFQIFSRTALEGMLTVKVAITRNRDLTQFLTPLRDAGLDVLWLGYHSRGVQNYINFHKEFLYDRSSEMAYLTFGEKRAELGVVSEDTIIYRRELEIGLTDFQTDEIAASQSDLKDELHLSTAAYQAAFSKELPKVLWLFGKDPLALARVEQILAKSDYRVWINEKSIFGGRAVGDQAPALGPAIGLALDELGWDSQAELRIYTQEQRQKQGLSVQLLTIGKFVVAGCILVAGLFLMMQAQLGKLEKDKQWVDSQVGKVTELNRIEAETNQYLKRIKEMEDWSNLRGRELEFLVALQEGIPEETIITDISFEDGAIRNIAGITPSVSLLLSKMQKDPILSKLKLKGNIAVTEQGLERFQMAGLTKVKETKQE